MTLKSEQALVRCAEWAAERNVELGGTAPRCLGYLLVEWPLPWPRDASEVPELADLSRVLHTQQVRLQLVRAVNCPSDAARVISYRRTSRQPFAGYSRTELTVRGSQRDTVAAAMGLVEAASDGVSAITPHACRKPIDVLVCSHGTRDACCGSKGTDLARRVAAAISSAEGSRTRIWRTTHLGGHRFAPTAVTLPDGVVWGRLDPDSLRAILTRDGDASRIAHLSRGCSGLESPEAQLLDRALFSEQGWEWLSTPRASTDPVGGRVILHAERSGTNDETADQWEASIAPGRDLPVPTCRAPFSGGEKREREYLLGAYRVLRR